MYRTTTNKTIHRILKRLRLTLLHLGSVSLLRRLVRFNRFDLVSTGCLLPQLVVCNQTVPTTILNSLYQRNWHRHPTLLNTIPFLQSDSQTTLKSKVLLSLNLPTLTLTTLKLSPPFLKLTSHLLSAATSIHLHSVTQGTLPPSLRTSLDLSTIRLPLTSEPISRSRPVRILLKLPSNQLQRLLQFLLLPRNFAQGKILLFAPNRSTIQIESIKASLRAWHQQITQFVQSISSNDLKRIS